MHYKALSKFGALYPILPTHEEWKRSTENAKIIQICKNTTNSADMNYII